MLPNNATVDAAQFRRYILKPGWEYNFLETIMMPKLVSLDSKHCIVSLQAFVASVFVSFVVSPIYCTNSLQTKNLQVHYGICHILEPKTIQFNDGF